MVLFRKKFVTSPLTITQQLKFMTRFTTLLDANYPVKQALEFMRFNQDYVKTTDMLLNRLKDGTPFDDILKDLTFHRHFIIQSHYGCLQGTLSASIKQAIVFIASQLNLRKRLLKTLRYPLFLISGFLIILYLIQKYIYPNFIQLFSTTGQPPKIIDTSIYIVSFFFDFIFITGLLLLIFIVVSYFIYKSTHVTQQMAIILRLPPLFKVVRLHTSFLFAHHLQNLMAANFSLKESLTVMEGYKSSAILNQAINDVLHDLNSGDSFYQSLASHPYFTDRLTFIFQTKEAQALLNSSLRIYTEETMDDVTASVETTMSLIQPIIFLVIALSIVCIYLSLLLPMINMMNSI